MNIQKKIINFALNILNNSTFSILEHRSSTEPFYNMYEDDTFIIENNIDKCIKMINSNTKILEYNKNLNLPLELIYIYSLLDCLDREFTFKNFTFMTFNEIINRYELYISNNQYKICDIAITYIGLGHIIILTYDINNQTFFFRYDGGSNEWDRDLHWEFIKIFNPENQKNKIYNLHETFNIIENMNEFFNYCIN